MKRLITATVLSASAALAQAASLYQPLGSNLTYGAVSNGQTIISDITNPAAGAAVLQSDGNLYRLGIPGSIGVGFEFGQVDDLYDRIDDEADKFQDIQPLTNTTVTTAVDELNSALASLNTVLADVESNGYAKAFGSIDVPLVVAHKGFGGSLQFDINVSFASRATGLHETVNFNSAEALLGNDDPFDDLNVTFNSSGIPTNFTVDNDSTILIKASMIKDISLGYSRRWTKTANAALYGGVRAHYYIVEHSRSAVRMADLTDVKQQFKDALDQDRSSDSGLGVDVGVLWVSEHYRAGATLTNINEPSFETGAVDLSGYSATSSVAQRLARDSSFTMEKQLTLEASLYTASQNWVISAGFDANAAKDPLGDEYQWATVSAAYATDTWWLPGLRVGIRKNLAGTEINYLTGGATIGALNLDIAWSTDSVTIDDSTVPRGAIVNAGLEFSF